MFLARVIGRIVASKKEEPLQGQKLVLLRPQLINAQNTGKFDAGKNTIVAVDKLGAGEGDLVVFCQGSSARQAQDMKALPIDAVIIGIVDSVQVEGKETYNANTDK